MGKVKGKNRLDKYYRLAKEHGYRSRAAWKLVQLDSKFSFLGTARATLDLGAAPGGWMQVAVQRMPVASLVLGVDLVPIRPIRGAVSFEGDITQSKCRSIIKKLMADNSFRAFDLVLHDGSPNIGGAWASEATSQNALVIDSLKLATEFLAPKGNFITKVFRSQDYSSVLYCLNQLFEKVEVDKPLASRSTSAEIYVICLKYKAPAKIDPRLLDMKHLFKGSTEPKKVVDVLRGTKQKRNREGYDDGDTILRKVSSVTDFIWSDTPLVILGSVTSISFKDPACLPIKDHILTTEEVKCLCDDLRVLGKQDFKHLLKWRMHIRKALCPKQKPESSAMESVVKGDEEERILNEMEELTHAMERKKKREKKLIARRQAKDKARKATGMQIDALEDGIIDNELFSLSSIKGKKELEELEINYDEDDDFLDSGSEEFHKEAEVNVASDLDSDEECKRYNDQLEEILDVAYEHYVAKKEGSTKQRKRAKQSYTEIGQLSEDGDGADVIDSDPDSENEVKKENKDELNPLMVPLSNEEAPTQEEITAKWFSQEIFAKAVEDGDLGKFDSSEDDEHQVHVRVNESHTQKPTKPKDSSNPDFEIVPPTTAARPSNDDSSEDDSSEDDVDEKAETLAYGKAMLRKKRREEIMDDAYNRYMFHDTGLPRWFSEEEKKHCEMVKPVTKEEIAAERAQFREINARPVKKVAEAKARKKKAAMKKVEKARKKADSISERGDIREGVKGRMIEEVYKKARSEGRVRKEYVVAKKGVAVKGGKGKVVVDRRMKKDKARGKMNVGKKGKMNVGKGGKGGKFQKRKQSGREL